MFPLKDTIRSRTFPVVNTLLIAINVLVFFVELSLGPRAERLISALGVKPDEFLNHRDYYEAATLITSMFLHAGWMHIFSNMLALYIFGDNVEDRMGPVRYLIFYLLSGIAAGLVHIWFNPGSEIPTIGASGAIAGVLGAYLILYPHSRVITLIPIFIYPWIVEIPALLYLGFWFLSQLLNGAAAIASDTYQRQAGVAWWAHAGGFVAGMLLVAIFARPKTRPRRVFADEYAPW